MGINSRQEQQGYALKKRGGMRTLNNALVRTSRGPGRVAPFPRRLSHGGSEEREKQKQND